MSPTSSSVLALLDRLRDVMDVLRGGRLERSLVLRLGRWSPRRPSRRRPPLRPGRSTTPAAIAPMMWKLASHVLSLRHPRRRLLNGPIFPRWMGVRVRRPPPGLSRRVDGSERACPPAGAVGLTGSPHLEKTMCSTPFGVPRGPTVVLLDEQVSARRAHVQDGAGSSCRRGSRCRASHPPVAEQLARPAERVGALQRDLLGHVVASGPRRPLGSRSGCCWRT